MSRTTVVIPEELREQAKALDINISDVCRYALESAIPTARAMRESGRAFEAVTIHVYEDNEEDIELVQFLGKKVYEDTGGLSWYVTPKNRIVLLQGGGTYRTGDDMEVFDTLADLRDYNRKFDDKAGNLSKALQAAETALGQAPTPRMLDI
jgi:hypothetical protein